MKKLKFLYLLFFFSICLSFDTINISFIRTIEQNEKKETFRGDIYYYNQNKITVKIIEPVLQWVILTGNLTLIYYPEEKRGLHIKSQSPPILPFFQAFIAVTKSDFGFSEIGFKLDKNELRQDTLFTYWILPEKIEEKKIIYILKVYQEKIIGTKLLDQKGNIISELKLSDHLFHGGFYFPLKMDLKQYQPDHTVIHENIVYTQPVFDQPFPEEVVHFTIPKNIEMKGIEW